MKKSIVTSVLLVSIIAFFAACTQAPQPTTIEKILNEKTLVVGTTGEQFPFSFKDDKGELSGIDIKIARNLAYELGVSVTFVILPFDQLIPAVKDGRVDIVFSGVSATPLRNTEVAFPGVYYKTGKSILSANKAISKGALADVNKKDVTLAVTNGTTSQKFIAETYPDATLVTVDNISEAVTKLNEASVDGLVTDFETAELISFAYPESDYVFQNLSSKEMKEFISPIVSADDVLFLNLVENYIERINTYDEFAAVDKIWRDLLN